MGKDLSDKSRPKASRGAVTRAIDFLRGAGDHLRMKLQHQPGGLTQNIFEEMFEPAIVVLEEGVQREGAEHWGRVASLREEVVIESVRELSEEEVAVLPSLGAPRGGAVVSVQKLRARHHEIARLMASGLRDKEIMETLGGSLMNLTLLRRNPAFQNLLLFYMAERDAQAMDLAGQIRQTAAMSLDLVQQKLEEAIEDPGKRDALGNKFLLEATTTLLDRAGFNPTQKHVVANVGVTAQTLKELQDAAPSTIFRAEDVQASGGSGGRPPGTVIDITPKLGEDPTGKGSEGSGPRVRETPQQGVEEIQLQLF